MMRDMKLCADEDGEGRAKERKEEGGKQKKMEKKENDEEGI